MNGCTGTDTMTVNVNPLPVIILGSSVARCLGDPYTLVAAGGAAYSWSPLTGLSCGVCSAPVATPPATTTYTVTVTSAYGCIDHATITITVNPLPVLAVTPSPVQMCFGTDTTLSVSGALTYTWSPAVGLSATTGSVVIAGPTASTTYTITGTDGNNCSSTVTDPVLVTPLSPPPVVVSPVKYCLNATASPLTATGTNLEWYTNAPSDTGSVMAPTPSTSAPGSQWYYVCQNSDGCEGPKDSIEVVILENVKTDFNTLVTVGCNYDSVSFINLSSNATSYLWTFYDGTTDTATNPGHHFNPVADTSVYWVKLVGVNGVCASDSLVKTFTLYPTPPRHFLYDVTPDQVISYGESIQLNSQGAWYFFWKPNDGTLSNNNINNPIATPYDKTTYTVFGYDHTGCLDSAKVTIDVITDGEGVPSAFTPNGDGRNDIFHVINLKYGHLVDMKIFNRWGQIVCHTTDNETGWDGRFNNVPQDMGVYNYLIIVERANHQQVIYKGDVTLIR